jgi:hypothetical protein
MRLIRNRSKGQALPIVALLLVAFIGLLGLALDLGRLYVARAELSRAVDSAALAGVIELPNQANAQAKASAYLIDNQPDAVASFPAVVDDYQIRVKGTRTVPMLFMGVFGFGSVNIDATATAGYGVIPLDAYLTLDATGSMHQGCNSNETNGGGNCPIKEARDAATGFVSTLLGSSAPSGDTLIGSGAFRGCYDPPRSNPKCISVGSMVQNLTSSASTLTSSINAIRAIGASGQPAGGSGTNVCLGLKKGQDVLFGPGHHTEPNTLRFLVILSDGDNVYNADEVNQSSPQSPDSPCRPSSPTTNDPDRSPNCRSDTQTQEAKVDTLTMDLANDLKAQGVEIYVVAFSVCGGIDTSVLANPCSGVGGGGSDSTSDHRLLKCIASSSPDSNDHYYETATASQLPAIFQQIAQAIAFRLVE